MKKNIIFTVNQVVKKSKYDVAKIAKEAGLTEGQLRVYMNGRIAPLEKYSALIKAFTNLKEIELAAKLISSIVDLNWYFYHVNKGSGPEIYPKKVLQELSVLIGNINKVFLNLESLDQYEKMKGSIDIQNAISLLHDLTKLIDRENRFLRLFI